MPSVFRKSLPRRRKEPWPPGDHHEQLVADLLQPVGAVRTALRRLWSRWWWMSIRTGQASVQAPQSELAPERWFQFASPAQVGRDHRADRALVGRSVGEAADVLEDRADVQAGSAADAVEAVALLRIGEDRRPLVVEEHEVHLLGAVALAVGRRGPA